MSVRAPYPQAPVSGGNTSVTVRRAQTIHDMRMVSITYGQCYSEKSADNPRYEDGEHYLRTVLQWEERRQSTIWGWFALPTNPGAQWLLIIISRTEGLMCGTNRRYMGDYAMAGLKLPKLCVWPVLTTKVTKKWLLIIMSRTDTKPKQNY